MGQMIKVDYYTIEFLIMMKKDGGQFTGNVALLPYDVSNIWFFSYEWATLSVSFVCVMIAKSQTHQKKAKAVKFVHLPDIKKLR